MSPKDAAFPAADTSYVFSHTSHTSGFDIDYVTSFVLVLLEHSLSLTKTPQF